MFEHDDGSMKEKLLEKILELFSSMPDKEEALPEEGKIDVLAVDAKPLDQKDKAIC